jgi:hypothetical protein
MAWSSISEANRAEPSFVPGLNAGGDARPVNLVTTRIRPYIGSCDREQAAGVIGGRQEEMAGAVSQCRAPAIPRQAFGGVMPTPGRGFDPPRDAWQAGDQATATGPSSPDRQVRLAFARGPVAATSITLKWPRSSRPCCGIPPRRAGLLRRVRRKQP